MTKQGDYNINIYVRIVFIFQLIVPAAVAPHRQHRHHRRSRQYIQRRRDLRLQNGLRAGKRDVTRSTLSRKNGKVGQIEK